MLETYLNRIFDVEQQGDAREESFYWSLGNLLRVYAEEEERGDIRITVLPKKTEAGNPDFRLWDGGENVIGYIEAKRPGTDLGVAERSEQVQRYRAAFPNVILTNFYEFRLYRDGERVDKVQVGRASVSRELQTAAPPEHQDEFRRLMAGFFAFAQPKVYNAEDLAVELARRTRFLEYVLEREIIEGEGEPAKRLRGFYEAFSQYLLAGITYDQFANLYAQTITYGLFAARSRARADDFSRRTAHEYIPRTVGILREVFEFLSYGDAPKHIEVIVDDIANVLKAADIGGILQRYFREGRGDDPILHFYETFLAEYDPELRERRGVYYTPEAVVGYIVRSLDHLLKDIFEKADGLADPSVTVLDPAAGTLTFIVEAFRQAMETYVSTYGSGGQAGFIREHLLANFYAFELMMAPYAIGHLKTGYILEELGHDPAENERFKLYLTNTLEMEDLAQTNLPWGRSLSEESRAAGRVKKEQPLLIVMGNPPYSGHSANNSNWIDALLKEGYTTDGGHTDDGYYAVDGAPLGEKNTKWLQDDYVKFLRFAQWKIDRQGQGAVGYITNHSFLDNPTFRGMRESLMLSFDRIYTLDLHGNTLKSEKAPDGKPDKNVFDIQQGVAITLLVKKPGLLKGVFRGDLRGSSRRKKYDWLNEHELTTTEWTRLTPRSPFYFFTERDYDLESEYNRFISLPELFPVNSVGVVTARDGFVIDFDRGKLERRIRQFRDASLPDDFIREALSLRDNRDWKMGEKRRLIRNDDDWKAKFTKILYRPFDTRHIFYHYHAIDFGREEVMRHMMAGDNLGLIAPKQFKEEPGAFVTNAITGHKTVSAYDINYLFPLYLYPKGENGKGGGGGSTLSMVFEEEIKYGDRRPNIAPAIYSRLEEAYGSRPSPEDILHYAYAVLYAPSFRNTYAEFLKTDFPRIPFTGNINLFEKLATLGKELVALHLMQSGVLERPTCRFHGKGSGHIGKSRHIGRNYRPAEEIVYINEDEQHFGPIPPEVWEYRVGGYQVLDKWLYDRREKSLGLEEIRHYCRVVTALGATIRLQEEIDALYAVVEVDLVA